MKKYILNYPHNWILRQSRIKYNLNLQNSCEEWYNLI